MWDGLDAYGREASGAFTAKITIGYEYPFSTAVPSAAPSGPFSSAVPLSSADAARSCFPPEAAPDCKSAAGSRSSSRRSYTTTVSLKDYRSVGLGGWTLDANHVYDPFGPTLHLGTGPRRGAQTLPEVVTTLSAQFGLSFLADWKINEKGEIIYASLDSSALIKVGRIIP